MPVPSSLADLSTTAASNSPAGSDAIGTSLDDYLRTTQALLKQALSKGTDIASASSITIPNNGNYCVVTGTTTIAGIADSWNGRMVILKFTSALTLTHSAALILPGATNLTITAGDCATFVNESTGVWRFVSGNLSNVTVSGNLAFYGTGNRITGDFSNATVANRVMFQTSTVNATTNLTVIPNGTASSSTISLANNQDPTNAGRLQLFADQSECSVRAERFGTGTYLPMTFSTGGSERMRIDTSGNVLVNNTAGLGYGTGAGGTVTQATSKGTAVTLNKPTGQITMNNAALASGAEAAFILNNSVISATDTVIVTSSFSAVIYQAWVYFVAAGACSIAVKQNSGGSRSDAVVLNFAVIKGATS